MCALVSEVRESEERDPEGRDSEARDSEHGRFRGSLWLKPEGQIPCCYGYTETCVCIRQQNPKNHLRLIFLEITSRGKNNLKK